MQSALVLSTRAPQPLFVPVPVSLVNFAVTLGIDIQGVFIIGLCPVPLGDYACSPPSTDSPGTLAIFSETYLLCFPDAIFVVYITAPSFSPILKGVVRLNDYKRTNTHDP